MVAIIPVIFLILTFMVSSPVGKLSLPALLDWFTWLLGADGGKPVFPFCSTRGSASRPTWPGGVAVKLTQTDFGVGASDGFFFQVGWWCFNVFDGSSQSI